jgi:hypothetical protein
MIQRIQSLYLFLTTLLSMLFLNGSILNFINKTGSAIKITFKGLEESTWGKGFELVEKLLPLSFLAILIPVIALATIFLFKKRNIQLWLVRILIVLIFAFIIVSGLYSYVLSTKYKIDLQPGIKMAVPVLQLIFSFLAFRGIKKDDDLVKSYDRLR